MKELDGDSIIHYSSWYTCRICGSWVQAGEWKKIAAHFSEKHYITLREVPLGIIMFYQKQRVLR